MTGHGYLGNIDPAFPGNSVRPNFEQPKFSKNLFPDYMGIPIPLPTNSRKSRSKNFLRPKFTENHILYQCAYW